MAGLIKKQILKHLSKFAKNLSADSINLSTLKGEGELNNLELDCIALQNLLDLPTWLQINHAKCNRVHVKIPWTKLKTTSITIFLDCVEMNMVTCEKPRPPNGPSPIEASASNGDSSYGFIEKVLEGITVRINSIKLNFTSAVFKAEVQISQLLVYSTDPDGKKADLRFTRIINNHLGQVLTFKKITWQTMRIVTDAASVRTGGASTPIRFITNLVTVEIVLRRKLSDLSVLASKLHVKFDDLLWVLSDLQVQSALLCVKSIRDTIERSRLQGRNRSASLTKQSVSPPSTPHPSDAPIDATASDPYFMRHVIHETSYHCDVDRVDLHICDDGSSPNTEASYKKVVDGGAILITLNGFKMDHYPYHKAGKSRSYFRGYNEISLSRDKWAEEIITQFRNDFVILKKAAAEANALSSKGSSKLLESCLVFRLNDIEIGQVTSVSDKERSNQKVFTSQRKELHLPDDMPLGTVMLTDYYYPDGRDYPAPHNNVFVRVNAPQLYAHWPSLLWMNQLSLSTIRSVQEMLEDLGVVMSMTDVRDEVHTDIRIEALMPKIYIPLLDSNTNENFPDGIEIHVSQATVTNCRHGKNASRSNLAEVLEKLKKLFLFNNSSFPHDIGHGYDLIHRLLEEHAQGGDSPLEEAMAHPEMRKSSLIAKAYKDVWSVWVRQIWLDFISKGDQNPPGSKSKSLPLLDSIPLTMWICKTETSLHRFNPVPIPPAKTESLPSTPSVNCDVRKTHSDYVIASDANEDSADEDRQDRVRRNKRLLDFYRQSLEKDDQEAPKQWKPIEGSAAKYIVVDSDQPVNLMMDHYQYLFLQRLVESIGGVGEKVANDTATILSSLRPSSTTVVEDTDSSGVRIILPLVNLLLRLRPSTADHPCGTTSTNHNAPELMGNAFEQNVGPPPGPYSTSPLSQLHGFPASSSDGGSIDSVSVLGEDPSPLAFLPPVRVEENESPQSSPRKRSFKPTSRIRMKLENRLKMKAQHQSTCDNTSDSSNPLSSGYRSIDNLSNLVSTEDDTQSCDSSGGSSLDQFVVLDMDPANNAADDVIVTTNRGKRPPLLPQEIPLVNYLVPEEAWSANRPMRSNSISDPQRAMVATPSEHVKEFEQNTNKPTTMEGSPEQVSLVRITASGAVEITVDSRDSDSSICIVAHQVDVKEIGDMSLDDAVVKFGKLGSCSPSATSLSPLASPCLRMRIDAGQCANRFYPGCKTHMQLEVRSLKQELFVSTLGNIGAFLEDDVIPDILPMKIDAYDVSLALETDMPLAYPNSARPPPIHLNVHEAHLRRDNAGTFHVSTESAVAPDLLKSLHFSRQATPTLPTIQSSEAAVAHDNQDVTSLRKRLEEVSRERDALAFALKQMEVKLESSKIDPQVTSLLD